ncbi:HAAS signaling domain-containing protein [Glycocaulis sp.]
MPAHAQLIERYCGDLENALKKLPLADRRDIVEEAALHLQESDAHGRLDAALAAFGPAREYASRFHDRNGQGGARWLDVRASGLAASLALGLLAFCFLATGIGDLLLPRFGLWVNPDSGAIFLGLAGASARAVEIAGIWLAAAALAGGLVMGALSIQTARLSLERGRVT